MSAGPTGPCHTGSAKHYGYATAGAGSRAATPRSPGATATTSCPGPRVARPTCTTLVSLCRHHHGLVHEGGWRLRYDTTTNTLDAVRPNGRPYEIRGRPPVPG